MSKTPKDGKLIYHLTSMDNMEGILRNGLLSRGILDQFDDVAEQEIINHRESKGLNIFVPFHFFAGTPFDGVVQKTYVDKTFVFLTLRRTFAQENNFRVLTQHPLSIIDSVPLSYLEGIEAIDWETMALRDYSNHECAQVCMAECLSPVKIEPSDFFCIYTQNEKVKKTVEELRNTIVKNGSFHVDVNATFFIK